jgi:hypothetical protein
MYPQTGEELEATGAWSIATRSGVERDSTARWLTCTSQFEVKSAGFEGDALASRSDSDLDYVPGRMRVHAREVQGGKRNAILVDPCGVPTCMGPKVSAS